MLNSLYIFILRLNNKQVSDGNFLLAVVETAASVAAWALYLNLRGG